DHGGDERDVGVDPPGQVGIDLVRELADDAMGHGAVVWNVVAGDQGQRAGTGVTSCGQPRDEPTGDGVEGIGATGAQGGDVGLHGGGLEVEATFFVAAVSRLGDGEGDDA